MGRGPPQTRAMGGKQPSEERAGKAIEGESHSPDPRTRVYMRSQAPGGEERHPRGALTFDGADEGIPILDHVLDELVGALQLLLVALQPLSEVGAVQVAVAELQRGVPHGSAGQAGRHRLGASLLLRASPPGASSAAPERARQHRRRGATGRATGLGPPTPAGSLGAGTAGEEEELRAEPE